MTRFRLLAAGLLLAAARALAGEEKPAPEPEPEEIDEEELELEGLDLPTLTAEAIRMLEEGEILARSRTPKPPEPEKPLAGSLQARLAEARDRRNP